MFDFAADARDEGGCKGRNNKGLVTYDRKTKKDSFFIYKAYWNAEPMVHVAGRRFADRAPGERTVTVYTNQPEVTLLLNGQPVATVEAVDHVAIFEELPLQAGANTVTARAGSCEDSITLNGVETSNPTMSCGRLKARPATGSPRKARTPPASSSLSKGISRSTTRSATSSTTRRPGRS